MGNMTLSVPDDLQSKMRQFSEVKWSEVARKAFLEKVALLEKVEELAKKSKLTKEDVKIFDRKIKALTNKRFHEASRH